MNSPSQMRIRFCAGLLVASGIVIVILGIVKFALFVQLGNKDEMEVFVEGADSEDIPQDGWEDMGGLFLGLAFLVLIVAICVAACATDRYHNGFAAKVCVFIAFAIFVACAAVYYTIGGFMIQPYLDKDWVEDNCEKLAKGKDFDENGLDGTGIMFAAFDEADKTYQSAVNQHMCTQFCPCEGIPADHHFTQYGAIPEATYASYGRTWSGAFDAHKIPIVFSGNNPDLMAYHVMTMKQCYENMAVIYDQKQTHVSMYGQMNSMDQQSMSQMSHYVSTEQQALAHSKPAETWDKLVTYFEKEYECAGFCKPALFYYSKPVSMGVPTQACVQPFMDDIDKELYDIGVVFILTASILVLMVLFALPVCAYCPTNRFDKPFIVNQVVAPNADGQMGNYDNGFKAGYNKGYNQGYNQANVDGTCDSIPTKYNTDHHM